MARFAQFAYHITKHAGDDLNVPPGPLSALLHWVGVYPHPVHDFQLHHQNAELALDPSTKPGRGACQTNLPPKNRQRVNFWGQSLWINFTGQVNPQIQVASSACCDLLRPKLVVDIFRLSQDLSGPTQAAATLSGRDTPRRVEAAITGSGLDHKEVLELLEEGERCIDLDMAGKIRSNLRVLGGHVHCHVECPRVSVVFSHLYGESDDKPLVFKVHQIFEGWSNQTVAAPWAQTSHQSAWRQPVRQPVINNGCSIGRGFPDSATSRQCLVSLHVLDNFKAPFKPWCNCWSPGSEETPRSASVS